MRSSTVIGSGDTRVRDTIPAGVLDTVAAVAGVATAAPSIEGTATIIGADGDRIGGDGPPTAGANWIDEPSLNPYRLAEGRAPPPTTRSSSTVARPSAATSPSVTARRCSRRARRRDRRRHRHVRRRRQPRPDHLHRLHARRRRPAARPPRRMSSVLVAAEDGVSRTTLREEIAELLPAHIEALTQARADGRAEGRHRGGLPRHVRGDPAGVRRDRPRRRRLQHPQHVLDPRGSADAGVGAAAGDRAHPGARSSRPSPWRRSSSASSPRASASASARAGHRFRRAHSGSGLDLPGGLVVGIDTMVIAGLPSASSTTLLASVAPAISSSRVAPLAALRDVAVDRSAPSDPGGRRRRDPGRRRPRGRHCHVIAPAAPSAGPASARWPSSSARWCSGRSSPARRPACSAPPRTVAFTGRLARRNAMRNPRRIAGSARRSWSARPSWPCSRRSAARSRRRRRHGRRRSPAT